MNADFRVTEIFTEPDTYDVIALCYDVLYEETFEKFLGNPDEFDGKENASNLLKDSNYEIPDEIRADIEDIFGVKEFDAENGYDDGYQFYDFGDDDLDFVDNRKKAVVSGDASMDPGFDEYDVKESFNLREALNKIDVDTDNKYDLLNLYEACNLSENEKRALANIVYDQEDAEVIYDTLNDRYVKGEEIGMPERVKDGVIHEDTYGYKSGNRYYGGLPNDEDIFGNTILGPQTKTQSVNTDNNDKKAIDLLQRDKNNSLYKIILDDVRPDNQYDGDESYVSYTDGEIYWVFDIMLDNDCPTKEKALLNVKSYLSKNNISFDQNSIGVDEDDDGEDVYVFVTVPVSSLSMTSNESKSIKESFSNFDAVDEFCNTINAKLGVDAFRHSFGGMVSFDKHQFINKEIFNSMCTDNSVIGETLTELGYVYDDKEDAYIKGNLYVFIPARGSQSHSVQFFEYEPKSIKEGVEDLTEEEIYNRVVNYLENHPYDFDRDTLDTEDISDEVAANLFGIDYFKADSEVSYAIFNAVSNYFEELDDMVNEEFSSDPQDLYKEAMNAYKRDDEDFFYDLSDDELVILQSSCHICKGNPYGAAYDDEVYSAIIDRPNAKDLFDRATKMTLDKMDVAELNQLHNRYFNNPGKEKSVDELRTDIYNVITNDDVKESLTEYLDNIVREKGENGQRNYVEEGDMLIWQNGPFAMCELRNRVKPIRGKTDIVCLQGELRTNMNNELMIFLLQRTNTTRATDEEIEAYGYTREEIRKILQDYANKYMSNSKNASLKENIDKNSLKFKLEAEIRDVVKNFGYDDDFVNDYIFVEVKEDKFYDGEPAIKCEIRTELSYEECFELASKLTPLVEAIDDNAYFDMEDSHTLVAYLDPNTTAEPKLTEDWEPEFSDEWNPEDIELWKSIDWKARNYRPYVDESNTIRGEVVAYGLPGGERKAEVMFAKELSPNPIYAPKWVPTSNPFEGTVGFMYDGVNHTDGYMMMTRTETQDVYDTLSH